MGCTFLVFGPLQTEVVKLQASLREHCPEISDLPTTDSTNENFIATRHYPLKGDPDLELSCNGPSIDTIAGTQIDEATPVGTLYVQAGCTFLGYELPHYEGNYVEYEGPLLYSEMADVFETQCDDASVACFSSLK